MDNFDDDDIDTMLIDVISVPHKLPAHLNGHSGAEQLYDVAVTFFAGKTTTTFTEIETMVRNHVKADIKQYGRAYVSISLSDFPITTRSLTIMNCFTR
jgi:hypothetical protein